MDIESLAQHVLEIQDLLKRFHQAANELSTGGYNAFEEFLQPAQNLLEESQQQTLLLQCILQNNPAGLAVVSGPDLIFRTANSVYRSMLHDPQVDLVGKPYQEIWPAETGFDVEPLIRQVYCSGKGKQVDQVEQRYLDGVLHRFTLRISPLTWRGEPGALILMQEITQADRARQLAVETAEKANHQAEELDAIITAMAEAVTIYNKQGLAVRANPAAVELFGIDPVGLDRLEMIELLSMRNSDGSPVLLEDLPSENGLRGETIIGQRLLLIDNQGRERVLRVSASPLFNSTGISAVVTVWHDVTERERLLEELEIEQSRLVTIIHNAPDAILVADEEGRLVMGNPAAERILGRTPDYGQDLEKIADLNICYDDGSPCDPRNLPLVSAALDGEQLNNIELMVVLPDGEKRNLLVSAAPIVDRKRNLNGAVGVFQDITQSKQAEEELRHRASRSQLLASLSRAFAEAGLNYTELLDTIVRQIGQVFGDLCILMLKAEDGEAYSPAVFSTEAPAQRAFFEQLGKNFRFLSGSSLAGQVFQTGQPVILTDVSIQQFQATVADAGITNPADILPETVNALAVPLRAHGRWIGALIVIRLLRGNHFDSEDQAFLQDLADRAALAIEDTHLYESEAQRARELQALHQATTALLSTIDLETLLTQILEAAQQAIPAAGQGMLYLLSEADQHLEVRAAFGCSNLQMLNPELQQQAARAIQEEAPLIFSDMAVTGEADAAPAAATAGSAIIAPLILPRSALEERRALGALALTGPHPGLFSANDLRLLNSFAATATAALQNATLYAQVQRLATTDSVTDQYNRRKFFELGELEMHRFRRFHNPLSAIMLDLDSFKEVNDTIGHGAGDQVLRTVAQRCRMSIRVVDILGRYGGDEFAILLPGADLAEAYEIAERIRVSITLSPVQTDQGSVEVSISLGVAQANEKMDGLSSLLGQADTALLEAKQCGRNRVVQAD